MIRKYKAIKITEEGQIKNERGDFILCPIRKTNCSMKCAWFSVEGKFLCCQNNIIGAFSGKPIRSFRLHTGPPVYDLDKSLSSFQGNDDSLTGS